MNAVEDWLAQFSPAEQDLIGKAVRRIAAELGPEATAERIYDVLLARLEAFTRGVGPSPMADPN